ncbi:MAG: hypothetical protein HN366_22120 [Deltaproteobacteria bacterium]|nr:hypothetical protein [Deltaproteobacteria bacterium]
MKKTLFSVLLAMFVTGFLISSASAQQVCWKLEKGLYENASIEFRLSFLSMGDGNYLLVGSSYATLGVDSSQIIRRVVTGGAVLVNENEFEVSLNSSDISDREQTEAVESLAISDIHFLLDSSLNGAYHIVNVQYADKSNPESVLDTASFQGVVKAIECSEFPPK